MSQFLRLLGEADKAASLAEVSHRLRAGHTDARMFDVEPEAFDAVPGKPFAYWVSEAVCSAFKCIPALEGEGRVARRGVNSNDDHRFIRTCWEVEISNPRWKKHPKGGEFSPYYADVHLVLDWLHDGVYLETERQTTNVYAFAIVPSKGLYFRPGLTWARRTTSGLSLRAMPSGCIFADKGPAAFVAGDSPQALLALLAILNSTAFGCLVSLQLAAADAAARSYEVGLIQKTPVPDLTDEVQDRLATLARRAWSLMRRLDTTTQTSHAFLLPTALRNRLDDFNPPTMETELTHIQSEIDSIAFDLYGFSDADRQAALEQAGGAAAGEAQESVERPAPPIDELLSWAVGVAFGRFDWRLATGERDAPPEPEPFDPLPTKSPGMLPDGAEAFHQHNGILVDEKGHPHDLVRLMEDVLATVDAPVGDDIRHWLRKKFFPYHLKQYSKSRRKAPIYWPLATASGNYTLWLYYPSLTSQTLFSAVNDFVEPKLKQVQGDLANLRDKGGARSSEDEKKFESLENFEQELIELRDTLLNIAGNYHPHHDDGVQITAAPLWLLFRHRQWRETLRKTWDRLEKGDYDWAHLAMNYWPERVREKCTTDKSLAIAHDLEDLYIEPTSD